MSIRNINLEVAVFCERLRVQRYAESSIKTYAGCLSKFLHDFGQYDMAQVTEQRIGNYMHYLITRQGIGDSYQKQMLGAIGKYFDLCVGRALSLSHLYPKRTRHRLPRYLSRQEVGRMLALTDNLKHRCILQLLYGTGMRVSEVVALLPQDIDSGSMVVHIRDAKGRRDRTVMLPEVLLSELRAYYRLERPRRFLFEGQGGGRYSTRSVQSVVQQAARRAGINRVVTPQVLRHSFATHLVESGTDIRYVQDLLGHRSVKTTELYTHVTDVSKSSIRSPLEGL